MPAGRPGLARDWGPSTGGLRLTWAESPAELSALCEPWRDWSCCSAGGTSLLLLLAGLVIGNAGGGDAAWVAWHRLVTMSVL